MARHNAASSGWRHQVVLKREDGSGILRPIIAHA
jgi:hypothetical protein